MYTNRPDLDATIPAERAQQVYGEIYGWFEKNASAFADSGAELQEIATATTVKSGDEGENPVVVDGPFNGPRRSSAVSRSSTSPIWTPRSSWPRPGRRSPSQVSRSRSGRSSTTAATWDE